LAQAAQGRYSHQFQRSRAPSPPRLVGAMWRSQALALAAVVALAGATDTPQDGQNVSEYKKLKADEKLEADAVVDKQKKGAAVGKVAAMLENLRKEVLAEGEAEAQAYNKFACWCKETTADKKEAIKNNGDAKTTIKANIDDLRVKRGAFTEGMVESETELKDVINQLKVNAQEHKEKMEKFNVNHADLGAALEALQGAIAALKASKLNEPAADGAALLQAGVSAKVKGTIRTSLLMADALGLPRAKGASRAAEALLQEQPEVEMEDFKFKSDDVISMLEKLKDDFRTTANDEKKTEVSRTAAYHTGKEEKTSYVTERRRLLDVARKGKADVSAELQSESSKYSQASADYLTDTKYLNELHTMCSNKAIAWDTRSQVRSDEIQALTTALGIIQGAVAGKTTADIIRFSQRSVGIRVAKAVASNRLAMQAIEADTEAMQAAPVLLQQQSQSSLKSIRRLRGVASRPWGGEEGRAAAVDALKASGAKLHSTALSTLATTLSADPFAKVTTLIQELIERLQSQANNEENQKGWCDKETGSAKQKRRYAAEEVAQLNSNLAKGEAERNLLSEEQGRLNEEIGELDDSLEGVKEKRASESLQNNQTVNDATEGQEELAKAIDVLTKFYKPLAEKEIATFAGGNPSEDAPDAMFDNEAYKGSQGAATGIIGMLEVMNSDFVRTIKETEKAEAQAVDDARAFETSTLSNKAQLQASLDDKAVRHGEVEAKISADNASLDTQTELVKNMVAQLMTLKATCVDTGMSYDDRVSRREEEIVALNKAYAIFNDFESYGFGGRIDRQKRRDAA